MFLILKLMKTFSLLLALSLVFTTAMSQVVTSQQSQFVPAKPPFDFPELPYAYDALEPHIDQMTMEIHYSKHHRAYYDNFMKAVAGTQWANLSMKEIFSNISTAPAVVRNNGGGYYNHILFWENLAPEGKGGSLSPALEKSIAESFGSFEGFVQQFNDAARGVFGSGWAWLIVDDEGKLAVTSTSNQDNPLMATVEKKGTPLLAIDVWEHAYYLKYQNRRPDYIGAFWNVVNWNQVNERFEKAQ